MHFVAIAAILAIFASRRIENVEMALCAFEWVESTAQALQRA
jgi:hypothetical protein